MWLDKLNALRKKSGMSLDEISKKSNVPKGTLSKITSGITKSPSIETIKSIVYSMGYKLEDLDDTPKNDYSLPEREHIKKYRRLNFNNRQAVDVTIDTLLTVQENEAEEKEIG